MAAGVANLIRAAAGSLPFVHRGQSLPDRTVTVDEVTIDRDNVAAYAAVTGLPPLLRRGAALWLGLLSAALALRAVLS